MKPIVQLVIVSVCAVLLSCNEPQPVTTEGNATMQLIVVGDTSLTNSNMSYVPLKNAKVILSSEYGVMIKYTDSEGKLILNNIASSTYSFSARLIHPTYPYILLVGTLKGKEIISGNVYTDTIKAVQVANTGIAINEIYSSGPVNNIFFVYDQFIELYNYSDEVRYLDGMSVMRMSGNTESGGKGPGADEGNDGDIDGVTYIFKFPGIPGEKNFPFYPKTYKVLASTAINHKNVVSTSFDLSHADWEFYNQFSISDFNNPDVPNLINLRSDKTSDFLINLISDVIVLASGVDSVWADGIDISTVIDGVQYKSSTTSSKTLDLRVDKSFMLSPSRYSGESMQRREPGGDSNDGISDWEIIHVATPGSQ